MTTRQCEPLPRHRIKLRSQHQRRCLRSPSTSRPAPTTAKTPAIISCQGITLLEVASPEPVFGGPIAAPAPPPPRGVAVGTGVFGTAVFGAAVAGTDVAVAIEVADAVGVAV